MGGTSLVVHDRQDVMRQYCERRWPSVSAVQDRIVTADCAALSNCSVQINRHDELQPQHVPASMYSLRQPRMLSSQTVKNNADKLKNQRTLADEEFDMTQFQLCFRSESDCSTGTDTFI